MKAIGLRRLREGIALATGTLLLAPGALASGESPAQESPLPLPLDAYTGEAGMTLWRLLVHRVEEDPVNLVATVVFLFAILHTFAAAPWIGVSSQPANTSSMGLCPLDDLGASRFSSRSRRNSGCHFE